VIDEMDLSADRAEHEREHAIANHKRRAPTGPGLEQCMECAASISEYRIGLGAMRCLPCQRTHEQPRAVRW